MKFLRDAIADGLKPAAIEAIIESAERHRPTPAEIVGRVRQAVASPQIICAEWRSVTSRIEAEKAEERRRAARAKKARISALYDSIEAGKREGQTPDELDGLMCELNELESIAGPSS